MYNQNMYVFNISVVHMLISSIYFMEILSNNLLIKKWSQLIEVTTFLAPRLTMLVASYLKNWVWRIQREIPQFSDIPFDTPKMLLESVHLFESCTWGNQATWMHDENTLQRKVSWRQKCHGGVFAIVYRWICALVLVPLEKLSWHKLPGWQFPKGYAWLHQSEDRYEMYMRELRHDYHFLDRKGAGEMAKKKVSTDKLGKTWTIETKATSSCKFVDFV